MKKLVTSIMASAMILGVTSSCVDHDFEAPISYQQKVEEAYDAAFIKEFGRVNPEQDWGFGEETKAMGTRASFPNANQWYNTYEVDSLVTEEEKNGVFKYVHLHQYVGTPKNIENFTNYFVSQVWKGDKDSYNGEITPLSVTYPNNSGKTTTIAGGSQMNQLQVKEGTEDNTWTHSFNFNNANNQSGSVSEATGDSVKGKMLLEDSGTYGFRYHNSNSNTYNTKYIVLKGSEIFGSTSKYANYYYVCFDYNNTQLFADDEKTYMKLSGSYEVYKGMKEGTATTTREGSFTFEGQANGTYYATPEEIGLDVLSTLQNNYKYKWEKWDDPEGTYVSEVKNVVITITESGNGEYYKYTKWTVTGDYVVTMPGTGAEEIWEEVKFNNENFDVLGMYKEADLTAENILRWKGVTGKTRNVSVSATFVGYLYGNKYIDGDGDYTDWIVRISPAIPKNTKLTRTRVYAEDLAKEASDGDSNSDWDFNDVVFDVVYDKDKQTSYVELQAAGGTLNLTLAIDGKDPVEVHEAFGVDQTTMVNTGRGDKKNPVKIFENIPGELKAAAVTINVVHSNGKEVEISAVRGTPAAKFAVKLPNGDSSKYIWPRETVHIESATFPNFGKWVREGGSLDDYAN